MALARKLEISTLQDRRVSWKWKKAQLLAALAAP